MKRAKARKNAFAEKFTKKQVTSLFPGNSEELSHLHRKIMGLNTCVFTLLMNLPAHRKNATKVNWNGFQKKSLRISTCGQATVSLLN